MADTYRTIARPCEGLYKEKMSRFLSFAHPVQSVDEAMAVVARYKKGKQCAVRQNEFKTYGLERNRL